MRTSLPALVLAGALAFAASPARAQLPEYEAKAEFLERFTRFVEWPPASTAEAARPFVIGIAGKDPFGAVIDRMATSRRIQGRDVRVQRLTDPAAAARCDLVFIAASEARRLESILAVTASRPILTVGDTPGFAAAGVVINLVSEDDRIGFEVNEGAAARSGLRLSARLLKLAHLVDGGKR